MIEFQYPIPQSYEEAEKQYRATEKELKRANDVYEQSGKCYDLAYVDVCKKKLAEAEWHYNQYREQRLSQLIIPDPRVEAKARAIRIILNWCAVVGVVLYGFLLYWMSNWMEFFMGVMWYVVFGVMAYGLMKITEIYEDNLYAQTAAVIGIALALAPILLLIVYVIGYIWYFVCGGFLFMEAAESFGDYVVYGLMSLVLLGTVGGFIAIACGWDPG